MATVAAIGSGVAGFLGSTAGLATVVGGTAALGAISSRNSTDKAINASQQAGNTASQQLKYSTTQAREDLLKLFPAAQQNTPQGLHVALDVFKQK